MIFFILYVVLGYWAAGKTIYRNYILIGSGSAIVTKKMGVGFVLGWILIPIAIIMTLLGK